MQREHTFLNSFMAGVYIGIAGLVYLSVNQPVVGALFFSFGLLVILSREYYLYTGKVGYLYPFDKAYALMLVKTLIGNFLGIVTVARLFVLTGIDSVVIKGSLLYQSKLDALWYETFILAIFCGMMMYIAVDSFKKAKLDILKVVLVIMAVVIFILAKFEHSVANMLYMFLGNTFTIKSFLWLFLMIMGNGIGAILLHYIEIKREN